jgi:hypothetical protein
MPLTFSAAAQHADEEHADDEQPAGGGSRSHQEHTAGAGSATPVANRQFGSGGACSNI